MRLRLTLAVLLGVTTAAGCASMSEETISLVAQKPMLGGWPWKRPAPSARVRSSDGAEPSRSTDAKPRAASSKTTSNEKAARFLASLPPELRERIEADLANVQPEERERLLAYLETVDPGRIPSLLDARRQKASSPESKSPEVVKAAVLGKPTFELSADEPDEGGVQQAAAVSDIPEPVIAPVPRPRRNPLVEIDPVGVEFDESPRPDVSPLSASSDDFSAAQTEPKIDSPPEAGPLEAATAPASLNPLTRLREWTTIRKPDPAAAAELPTQTAQLPADASALSLQGLSRRLRGGSGRADEVGVAGPTPPAATDAPYLHEGVQRLISLMEAETARLKPGTSFAEREEYVKRHAELRMLYLMSGQPALAQQAIPGTDVETQEFWTCMLWSMSNYFDNESLADPSERASATLDRLRAAEQHLQTTARIELRSLTFCDSIDRFGEYHPFERDVFRPGQEILLYAEVQNFKTEVTAAGRYRTSLKSTIEIIKGGEESELIERRVFDSTEDQSRSLRTDYFHSYKLALPLHLTPGSYSLRLTLEDELSGKIGSSTIDFLIR